MLGGLIIMTVVSLVRFLLVGYIAGEIGGWLGVGFEEVVLG